MKSYLLKWTSVLLAVVMAISLVPVNRITVFAAAKPTLSATTKTVIGEDQEFKLTIKNLTKSKVKSTKWSTTNKKVVEVDNSGNAISIAKGTAYIKCKITYKTGSVTTLSCKVTVKIPATSIQITNAQDDVINNSRQVIAVGASYDFNSVLTPKNSDNYITYSINNTDLATVNKSGVVTGKRPGFVILTAKAKITKPSSSKNSLDSIMEIKDSINIEIVAKTASVTGVTLKDTTTLVVTFDNPIDKTTLIGENDELLNNISITAKTDSNGVVASGLGDLKGSLSSDNKTLTISTTGNFNGLYGIHFTRNILTTDKKALMEYYQTLSLYDTTDPTFKDYTVDDTGLIVSINFSEAMDFSGMQIESAELVTKNTTAKASTISKLSNETNYKASADGKSLIIDLSNMSSVDENKKFMVVFSGLRDKAGNYPESDRITAYLATDTSAKPQAKLVSLERVDHDTLTATFSRAIKTPGKVILSNGTSITGVVDDEDTKKVNFTLDSESAQLTGKQEVEIGYWDSYNVSSSDSSADKYIEKTVNFTIDNTLPELTDSELIVDSDDGEDIYTLVLTYDKDVTLIDDDGVLTAKLVTDDGDVFTDYDIPYEADEEDNIVSVILDSDAMDESGTYTITIPEEFVKDDYGNTSLEETVKVTNSGGSSSALPAPKKIVQSSEDASIVYVTFATKLDETTAEDIDNYDISGADIISAELTDNTSGSATVELKLQAGSVSESSKYNVTVKGITGYHNTYTEMEEYTTQVYLHENVGPVVETIKYTYPDIIKITFDEDIEGKASFQVMQNGVDLAEKSEISGDKVIITLEDKPTLGESIQIIPTQYNDITDKYGNSASIETESIVPTN